MSLNKAKLLLPLTCVLFINSSCEFREPSNEEDFYKKGNFSVKSFSDTFLKVVDFAKGLNFFSEDANKILGILNKADKAIKLGQSFDEIDNKFNGKLSDEYVNLIKTCSVIDSLKGIPSGPSIPPSITKICEGGLSVANLTQQTLNELCGNVFTVSLNTSVSGKFTITKKYDFFNNGTNQEGCSGNTSLNFVSFPLKKTSLCGYKGLGVNPIVANIAPLFGNNKLAINYDQCEIRVGSNSTVSQAIGETSADQGYYLTPGLYEISAEKLCSGNEISSCYPDVIKSYIIDKFKQTYAQNSDRNHIKENYFITKDNKIYISLPPLGQKKQSLSIYNINLSGLFKGNIESIENYFLASYQKIQGQCEE